MTDQPIPNDPIPGSEWKVNDDTRPKPETITPGNITTQPPFTSFRPVRKASKA